jgi:SlyX protein
VTDQPLSDQHLIDLQTKLSHQEHVLEELQAIVYEQGKAIATLEAKVTRLLGLAEGSLEIGPGNDPPPHY